MARRASIAGTDATSSKGAVKIDQSVACVGDDAMADAAQHKQNGAQEVEPKTEQFDRSLPRGPVPAKQW